MTVNKTTKSDTDKLIHRLKEYRTNGGKIPPAMIDEIVNYLGHQELRIAQQQRPVSDPDEQDE